MTRTRPFAPLVGLAALAALTAFAAPHAARAQTYTVTDLTPAGTTATASGISPTAEVGAASGYAALWHGSAITLTNLHPAGFNSSEALGVSGNTQVGYGYGSLTGYHALLWHGTATSAVDLTPAGVLSSIAYAVSSDTQVGEAEIDLGYEYGNVAVLWHGTAQSAVMLTPSAYFVGTAAYGVDGDTQVGKSYTDDGEGGNVSNYATLWHGTADSAVLLAPPRSPSSFAPAVSVAYAVSGDTQVGVADYHGGFHAVLWHGTAKSIIDLHPAGQYGSQANAVSGNTQAGQVITRSGDTHAYVWHGTAASAVDLNRFLPAGFTHSSANGVTSNGDIVGIGYGSNYQTHAFLWHLDTPPGLFIARLSRSVIDIGHAAFTDTAYGTGFTRSTVIRANGQALPTTYFSSTRLLFTIPASLLAHTGTADITAQTPGLATSGAVTFHIRPVISSLSPATIAHGYNPVTITINGSGFTRSSIAVYYYSSFTSDQLPTTYVSSTKLTATLSSSVIGSPGRRLIDVTVPHVATSLGSVLTVTP